MIVKDIITSIKERTIKPWSLWDQVICSFLEKNESRAGIVKRSPFYMDLKALYSGESNVVFVYTVDNLPPELEVDFRTSVRKECEEGVRISFITDLKRHSIQWRSPQMQSKIRTWKILDEEIEEEGVDAFNLYANLTMLDSNQRKKDSLVYLSTAEIRRRRKLFKTRQMMLVSGIRGASFDSTIENVERFCSNAGIKITRVMLTIQDYLSVFSPFSDSYNRTVYQDTGSNVLTDELVARFNTCSQGKIGKTGIYWGTDIYSSFPCLKPVKRTAETAENWVIIGETGSGKSFFIRVLILQLLAMDEYVGTIMDVEGFEYLPIAYFLAAHNGGVEILNMAEGVGAYYDSVEIVLTGNKELDADMFSLSRSFTISTMKTLARVSTTRNEWLEDFIERAVGSTYSKRGVDESDISTWERSKGLSFFDVYAEICNLEIDEREPVQVTAKKLLIERLSKYFEQGGSRSSLFRQRIPLSKVIQAKLVVCSFGMAGKSPQTIDPTQMALMQLSAAMISHIRSIFAKFRGLFNFKLWEEFQRWGGFPDSEKTISTALTGGRKLGDINIIISNKASEILNSDKFGILENWTSFAIGSIGDKQVRRDLCNRLSITGLESELDRLVIDNKDLRHYVDGDNIVDSPYSHAFLLSLDKTVFTVSKMRLPKSIADSDLFRTGVDLEEGMEGEIASV